MQGPGYAAAVNTLLHAQHASFATLIPLVHELCSAETCPVQSAVFVMLLVTHDSI